MEKIPSPLKKTEAPRKARKPSKYMEVLTAIGLATGLSPAIQSVLGEKNPDREGQKSSHTMKEGASKTKQPKVVYIAPESAAQLAPEKPHHEEETTKPAPVVEADSKKTTEAPPESAIEQFDKMLQNADQYIQQSRNAPASPEAQKPTYETVSAKLQEVVRRQKPFEDIIVECKNLDSREKIKIIEDLMRAFELNRPEGESTKYLHIVGGYLTESNGDWKFHLGAPGLIAELMNDDEVALQYVFNRIKIGEGDETMREIRQGIKYQFQGDAYEIEKILKDDEYLSKSTVQERKQLLEVLSKRRSWLSELGMQEFKLGGIDRDIKRIESSLK